MKDILRKILALLTLVSLLEFGFPVGSGAYSTSFKWAKATISDSAPSVTGVTYTFEFYMNNALNNSTDTISVTFPSAYSGKLPTDTSSITCPTGMTPSTSTLTITCTGTQSAGTTTVTVADITNPDKSAAQGTADTYKITVETSKDEGAKVMVAIIEAITVTATVEPTLQFTVSGLNPGASVNGATTTATTTATTIPFGTLEPGTTSIAGQEISVTTNASHGFVVNIYQDQNLTNAQGDDIDCFSDGNCVSVTSTQAWASPSGVLDQENTYGHFGLTSQDSTLGTDCSQDYYGNNQWAGFNGTNQNEVMCHTGPADGSTEDKGLTRVGFAVEISALQEAGEYTNTLTYIVTPTY